MKTYKDTVSNDSVFIYNGRAYIVPPDGYSGTRYSSHKYILRSRYVVETSIKRYLSSDEHVHHIDGNTLNDTISNLEVLNRSEHAKRHAKCGRTMVTLVCPGCGNEFTRERRKTHLVNTRFKVTCCSRRCVGIYSHKM